jgi:NADH-ubiquinone oxidoreductase chain 5
VCGGGVIHSVGDYQDIRFMGSLSVYILFTSSSLIVSNFALCGMPFLAGFYSRDFILEMFGFVLLFVSTGSTVCYSFRLFCFLCGDFNFVPSYSMVETSYNIWYNWFIDYVYFWWRVSYVVDLPFSFYDHKLLHSVTK